MAEVHILGSGIFGRCVLTSGRNDRSSGLVGAVVWCAVRCTVPCRQHARQGTAYKSTPGVSSRLRGMIK